MSVHTTYHVQQHNDTKVDAHGSPCGCNLRVIPDERPLEGCESADGHYPVNDDPEHGSDDHTDLAGRQRVFVSPSEHFREGSHPPRKFSDKEIKQWWFWLRLMPVVHHFFLYFLLHSNRKTICLKTENQCELWDSTFLSGISD